MSILVTYEELALNVHNKKMKVWEGNVSSFVEYWYKNNAPKPHTSTLRMIVINVEPLAHWDVQDLKDILGEV